MHLKDTRVDPALKGYDRYAAFCELGAGVVDIEGIVDVLLDADYDGLAIIELDASQKTAEAEHEREHRLRPRHPRPRADASAGQATAA